MRVPWSVERDRLFVLGRERDFAYKRRHTAFLFLSTSLAKFASSSLISFNRDAKRSLLSAMISCIFIVVCHALTKELRAGQLASWDGKESRSDGTGQTHPALPSFMAYRSAVFLASFCMPLPSSSSSTARFLKNVDASCRRGRDRLARWHVARVEA